MTCTGSDFGRNQLEKRLDYNRHTGKRVDHKLSTSTVPRKQILITLMLQLLSSDAKFCNGYQFLLVLGVLREVPNLKSLFIYC